MHLFLLAALAGACLVQAATQNINLEITRGFTNLDGLEKFSWLINGQSPGPTITATIGDTLNIAVTNQAFENITIHWHGVEQRGTPWSDGVPGLTQFPVKPGQTFIYNYEVTQTGYYWYHSHHNDQLADGFRGSLVFLPGKTTISSITAIGLSASDQAAALKAELNPQIFNVYDNQRFPAAYLFQQWHQTGLEQLCADDILINGKGQLLCPNLTEIAPLVPPPIGTVTAKGCGPPTNPLLQPFGGNVSALDPNVWFNCQNTSAPLEVFNVNAASKFVVFNLVNSGALWDLKFAIDSHSFWVFAADGAYIQPSEANTVVLPVSERFQVLVKLDQQPGNYAIRVASVSIPQLLSGFAVLSYETGINPTEVRPTCPPSSPNAFIDYGGNTINKGVDFNVAAIAPFPAQPPPQGAADVTVNLSLERTSDFNWTLNGVPFSHLPDSFEPLLFEPSGTQSLNPNLFTSFKNGSVVDIIITITVLGNMAPHPNHNIHKHGTKAWFLGTGTGAFPASTVAEAVAANPSILNLSNPPLRDDFFTLLTLGGQSWAALRFISNNPGPTFIHCHLDEHLQAGMAFVLMEGFETLPSIPSYYRNFS